MHALRLMTVWKLTALALCAGGVMQPRCAHAQTTVSVGTGASDSAIDRDAYLRGLADLHLPELMERYIADHPPRDAVERALDHLMKQRLAAMEPGLTGDARLQRMADLLSTRDALIAAYPKDWRRGIWLADQATDVLFDVLTVDALGTTALFGRPPREQRDRVVQALRNMQRAADDADLAVRESLLRMEDDPVSRDDPVQQERRRRLVQDERERRIPFLRSTARVMRAWIDTSEGNASAAVSEQELRDAAGALGTLVIELDGRAARMARLYGGLALARLKGHEGADALFREIASDSAASPMEVFEARMAGVLSRAHCFGAAEGLDALGTVQAKYAAQPLGLEHVIMADRAYLLRAEGADSPAGARGGRHDAIASYLGLLTLTENERDVNRQAAVRSAVLERLTDVLDEDADLSSLPAIVSIARAQQLARAEATRAQAIVLLETALTRGDARANDAALALWTLGRVLAEEHRNVEAARRFLQLATEHERDSRAEAALETALSLAVAARADAAARSEASEIAMRGFELLFRRYPFMKRIDDWRITAARVAAEDGRAAEGVAQLRAMPVDSPRWPDAAVLQVRILRDEAATGGTESHRALLAAVDRVIGPLEQQAAGAASDDPASLHVVEVRAMQAEGLIALGDGAGAMKALESIDTAHLPSAMTARIERLRVNAARIAGRLNEVVKALIESFDRGETSAVLLTEVMEAVIQQVEEHLDAARTTDADALARDVLAPLAERLAPWSPAQEGGAAVTTHMLVTAADALRLAGRHAEALSIFDTVIIQEPDALRPLFGRAECLLTLGLSREAGGPDLDRLAEAMALYKRIAAGGLETVGRRAWWMSQLRMLEILDATGRNLQQIAPRIRQLRLQDAELGGERTRRGFEYLQNKHAN